VDDQGREKGAELGLRDSDDAIRPEHLQRAEHPQLHVVALQSLVPPPNGYTETKPRSPTVQP